MYVAPGEQAELTDVYPALFVKNGREIQSKWKFCYSRSVVIAKTSETKYSLMLLGLTGFSLPIFAQLKTTCMYDSS